MVGKGGRKSHEEEEEEEEESSSSSTRHACAACRHQRRKCKQGCVMAPYFPADKMEEFQDVHRIFGVSNITKCLESLETQEARQSASQSFKWEAKAWKLDPSNGPLGAYNQLKSELQNACKAIHLQQAAFYQNNNNIISSSANMNQFVCNNNVGAHSIINPYRNFSNTPTMPTNNGSEHQRLQFSINQRQVVEQQQVVFPWNNNYFHGTSSNSNGNGNGNVNGGPILLYRKNPTVGQQPRQPPTNNLPLHQFPPPPPPPPQL